MQSLQRNFCFTKTILLLLAGGAFALSAMAQSAQSTAMLECSGLPCVDVTIAGATHLRMLIDTGNVNSILDSAVAKQMGLDVQPFVGRDGKPIPEYSIATLSDVRVGDLPLGDLKVLVLNLQPDMQKGIMPKADGLLTYPVFKGRVLTMDYKTHRVEVSEKLSADRPCPNFCGALATPTFGKQGPPILTTTGFQLNGKPIVAQIDTMYSGSMLIYSTSVDKLGLQDQQKSTAQRMFTFTDGGVNMIEGTAAKESFGDATLKTKTTVYFATAEVHQPDGMFDGTVGHELFLGHVLTFDFRSNHFWMD
jgi:hypothetical protein